ncbi:transcription and mRNA export factor ENY2-like [Dysidea avara]|uniref:transcription and mRNA export factor ENY2-like n=1 Tax=Dysidea avara TaxID=196820 RepID=UPI003333B8A1
MAELNEKRRKEEQMQQQIYQKLDEDGQRERLKDLLRTRLRECGWRDQVKEHCKDVIREKGLEQITVDMLVTEITPKARSIVPDYVKKELLQQIKDYLNKS